MTFPTARIDALLAATWPPAATRDLHGIRLQKGQDGGSRVSAALLPAERPPEAPLTEADLHAAETAMREMGQRPLFRLAPGQQAADRSLAEAGYRLCDSTLLYCGPVAPLAARGLTGMTTFQVWPPLGIQREIWTKGGIGAARRAVMHRVTVPKTSILGRVADKPAGAAFGAVHDGVLMAHAIEVLPDFRRRGVAEQMLVAMAMFGQDHGADIVALLTTEANGPARALYDRLGLTAQPAYHYRLKESPDA